MVMNMRALSSLILFALPLCLEGAPLHSLEAPKASSGPSANAGASAGPSVGPSGQPPKGVGKSHVTMAPYWVSGGIKSVLRDVPGAVVTVEDTLDLMPHLAPRLSLMNRKMRLTSGERRIEALSVPPPDWMNPMVFKSGGNVVQRAYDFGGVQY